MNIDLLSQNLALTLCATTAGLLVYCLTRFDKRWLRRRLWPLLGASYIAAFLMQLLINYYVGGATPFALVFMMMPFTFAVGVFAFAVRHKHRPHLLGGALVAASLLFGLVMINGFYRFYPTLGAVFDKIDNVQPLDGSQGDIAVHFSGSDAASSKKPAGQTAGSTTLEQSLDSLSKQPTAGKVYALSIPAPASNFTSRGSYVYVPAIASTLPAAKLPVIVLSAGFPGIPQNWLDSGLQQTMDDFAAKHQGIAPLVFMVDNTGSLTNDTECVNSPRGNVETYLTVDVPNYIKSHFSVSTNPANWAMGGLSMGGMCSIMLTLRHPNVYHYFDDLAGEIGPEVGSKQQTIDTLFGGSEANWAAHQPDLLLAKNTYPDIGGFFGVGKDDALLVTSAEQTLYKDAQKAGVQSVFEEIDGQHTFDVWQQLFKDSLPWLSNRLGATTCSDASCY